MQSTTPDLGGDTSVSMEFLRSFLRRHFAGKPVVASLRFFIGNCKPQTANRKMSRDHGLAVTFAVCSSRLNRRKGFKRQVIYSKVFATKNCTASRLKAWTSFLYPFAMYSLDFWSRINELLLFFGRVKYGGPQVQRQNKKSRQNKFQLAA